jgi:recombinational DNA repair protein RecT
MERNREKLTQSLLSENMYNSVVLSAGDTFKSWDEGKQRNFVERFAYEVCTDENLSECFTTVDGKRSIVQAFRRSLETGLVVGGKHAYLVPQRDKQGAPLKVRFSIKAEGYIALLCGGKQPIFRDIRWGRVHEEDDFSVDEATGEVHHTHGMVRGEKWLGIWVQITKLNGERAVFTYDIGKINQWRASSQAPKYTWEKWPQEMAEQACIRHACKRFEEAKDMLSDAWGADAPVYDQSDDIAERAAAVMPDIDDLPEDAETGGAQMPEQAEEKKEDRKKNTDEKKAKSKTIETKKEAQEIRDGDLF